MPSSLVTHYGSFGTNTQTDLESVFPRTDAGAGTQSLNNSIALINPALLIESFLDAVTAGTTQTQAGATALTGEVNRIATVGTIGDGVKLPASQQGLTIFVINDATNACQVYGTGADTIDAQTNTTGVLQMGKSVVLYSCVQSGKWQTEGLSTGFDPGLGLQTLAFANTITAFATGGQASATKLTKLMNRLTTVATQGDSVALPPSAAGMVIYIDNQGANICQVYGDNGAADTINGVATGTGIAQAPQTVVGYFCHVAGNWETSASGALPVAKFTSINVGTGTLAQGNITGASYVSLTSTNATPGNQTPRTATQMFNDTPGAQVGMSYVLRITNTGAGTFTLAAGATGVTLTGTMTVPQNTTRDFIVTFNSATTLTIQAIGVGTFS